MGLDVARDKILGYNYHLKCIKCGLRKEIELVF